MPDNGHNHLIDAIECTVEEELNGVYRLHMIYPVNGAYASYLKPMNIIMAPPATGKDFQAFDIIRVSMPSHDRLEIDAKHVSFRLNAITIQPFAPESGAKWSANLYLQEIKNKSYAECYFDLTASITGNIRVTRFNEPMSVRKAIGIVQEEFGGDFIWNNFTVTLVSQRGANKQFMVFRYGKDIAEFHKEENAENLTHAVVPFWVGRDANKKEILVNGGLTYDPNISIPANEYLRTIPLDLSDKFDSAPTAQQLKDFAKDYLTTAGLSTAITSVDASVLSITRTADTPVSEEDINKAYIGDTITIEHSELDISVPMRIVRVVYDVLNERYTEVLFGSPKITNKSAEAATKPIKKEVTQINSAVNAITESETALITLPSGFTNNSEMRNFYYRKGSICMIGFDCTPSSRVSDVTLVTLPATCRPVTALRLSALPSLSRGTDDGDTQFVAVKADGVVTYTGSARLCQVYTFICKGG